MKKINFELIRKIDYLLVFLVAIIGFLFLIIQLISDIFPIHHSQPAHIDIIDTNDEESFEKTIETIDFLKKNKDTYVFSVSTSAIQSGELSKSTFESVEYSNVMQRYSSDSEIVNFIFVKDDNELKLFSSKVFIYKYQLSNDDTVDIYETSSYAQNIHSFNIYAVIKEDTNNDNQLNSKDNITLYVSDYDGKNLKEISSSIYYIKCIDKNTFIFTEYENGKVYYYEYNDNGKKLIKAVEKEIKGKEIYLY